MKISVSFLSKFEPFSRILEKINKSKASFIHVDVLDGIYTNSTTFFNKEMMESLKKSPKKIEVHLMTLHLKKYIDLFSYLNPEVIIYEFEATTKSDKVIKYIKDKNCKVGIAINPFTPVSSIIPYLKKIDLVLVMSVIPGYGSQKFIMSTKDKIKELEDLRKSLKANFLISVDGGINEESLKTLSNNKIDRAVAGSFVCNSANYDLQITTLEKSYQNKIL